MTADRTRLRDRRMNWSERLEWCGRVWLLCVGFDQAGKAREIFLRPTHTLERLETATDRACVHVSRQLQSGFDVAEVLALVDRLCEPQVARLIETALRQALELERDQGGAIRLAYSVLPK